MTLPPLSAIAPTTIADRVHDLDWAQLRERLDTNGFAITPSLLEQRPRAQSRAHVLEPERGGFVIFPTRHRPRLGSRGYHRVGMRHGVSTITSGSRTALGIIFHDAA
jgi:hypothetical protein